MNMVIDLYKYIPLHIYTHSCTCKLANHLTSVLLIEYNSSFINKVILDFVSVPDFYTFWFQSTEPPLSDTFCSKSKG